MNVIVEYEIHEGAEGQFLSLLRDHALLTRQQEPGCLRFDIVRPIDEATREPIPGRLVLHEVYADDAALAAHMATPRLAGFRAATAPLVKSRRFILGVPADPSPQDGLTTDELNASNDR